MEQKKTYQLNSDFYTKMVSSKKGQMSKRFFSGFKLLNVKTFHWNGVSAYIHLSKWPRFVSTNLQSMIWKCRYVHAPFMQFMIELKHLRGTLRCFGQDIQHQGHLWCSRKTLVFQIQASSIEVQLFQYIIEIFANVTYYQGHTPPAGAFWKNRL